MINDLLSAVQFCNFPSICITNYKVHFSNPNKASTLYEWSKLKSVLTKQKQLNTNHQSQRVGKVFNLRNCVMLQKKIKKIIFSCDFFSTRNKKKHCSIKIKHLQIFDINNIFLHTSPMRQKSWGIECMY